MNDQRAPTAADVEQPHPRPELQLAADEIELVALSVLQCVRRVIRRGPIGARVDQGRAEDDPVEVVAHVVVVAYGRAVAIPRVPPAGKGSLLRWWLRLRPNRPQDHSGPDQLAPVGRRQHMPAVGLAQQRRQEAEYLVEVSLHVQLTGDVGPPETQL